MINKIQENIKLSKYTEQIPMESSTGYVAGNLGWTDYLLTNQIIFSHRINNFTPENLPEDLHSHNYYELVICAGGEQMQYIADDQYLTVQPGTVILTKPMAIHMFRPLAPTCYDRYILYFKPTINIFCENRILDFLKTESKSNSHFFFPEIDSICQYVSKAEQALSDTSSPYSAANALLQICNLFITLSNVDVKNTNSNTSHIPKYLYKIKGFIDREYININTVSELAEKFHYSREYLARGFSSYFNTPLYEYILKRKILHCCNLLTQGESVEKSARLSGFSNLSGFTRVFKKFMGCTPTQYKQKEM